ncbi:hypothetical protein IV203_016107 [Nitzschia inconspicua]|uniref:Uncharacterized protein n=1 Tax=Nitzschia inconspicua TaxID=303405 RepID=A0A9K3KP76_9STRA|nr:hypothetical protein IV203_016107 [Nitzschia inconspicua]
MPELRKYEVDRLPLNVAKALYVVMLDHSTNNSDCFCATTSRESHSYMDMMAALEIRVGSYYRPESRSVECDSDPIWEWMIATDNKRALTIVQRHMYVEVRNMNQRDLTTEPTPNGKFLPIKFAKRFKQWNVLQLLRRHPDDIQKLPARTLESFRSKGLTLTERRALHAHLSQIAVKWGVEATSSSVKANLEAMHKCF